MIFNNVRSDAAILLCFGLMLGLASAPARAEMVDVTGVAAEDVLNLRAEPRANAPLAGALSPTAAGVEVERRSGGWVYVRFGQQSGWASARYLRPAMTFSGKPPSPLQCLGTEPFWSLTIESNSATFQTPEKDAATSAIDAIRQSRNSTIVWLVRTASGPVASAIVEARQACSDNMSDRVYSYRVTIETRDGQLLSGCCETGR